MRSGSAMRHTVRIRQWQSSTSSIAGRNRNHSRRCFLRSTHRVSRYCRPGNCDSCCCRSVDPAAILPTTLFASVARTTFAIRFTFFLQRFFPVGAADPQDAAMARPWVEKTQRARLYPPDSGLSGVVSMLALGSILGLIPITILWGRTISPCHPG